MESLAVAAASGAARQLGLGACRSAPVSGLLCDRCHMIDFSAREPLQRSRAAAVAALAFVASSAFAQLPNEVPSLAPMIEHVSPAVVNIAVSGSVKVENPLAQDEFLRRFFDFDGQNPNGGKREIEAAGSGVI